MASAFRSTHLWPLLAVSLLAFTGGCDSGETAVTEACERTSDTNYVRTEQEGGAAGTIVFWDAHAAEELEVYLDPSSEVLTEAEQEAALKASIAVWQTSAGRCSVKLNISYAGQKAQADTEGFQQSSTNRNGVFFITTSEAWRARGNAASAYAVTVLTTNLATGEILDADIEMNEGDHKYSTENPTPADRADLESVLTHEIGHILGFGHTDADDAMMNTRLPEGVQKRVLTTVDNTGLCEAYACY